MSSIKKTYICKNCGASYLRWSGRCETCGEWNCLEEEISKKSSIKSSQAGEITSVKNLAGHNVTAENRTNTGMLEFDRVLGGGLVPGSIILLGGEPGIGKSTLALQICSTIIKTVNNALYISGEESAGQVKNRWDRIKNDSGDLNFANETMLENIVVTIEKLQPSLILIDSVQTIYSEAVESLPGSVSQVKNCAIKLIELGKKLNIPIILIGHVTKEGTVAGPKTLEHLVDTVLYLEGERFQNLRILRSIKNRFGSTNVVGVFKMKKNGLQEISEVAKLFIQERLTNVSGSIITSTIEGNRNFMLEVQGLTTRTVFGYPKRTSSGLDLNRLQLLIAILTKRANIKLGDRDVYLNIVGGFKISEPAADLAVCLAIASSYYNKVIKPDFIAWGEVGLAGEVRSVSNLQNRISEAKKLGFKKLLIPSQQVENSLGGIELIKVSRLSKAMEIIFK